ncbi:MAG TPA: hypothetical protein VNC50_10700 [Planctomycetia bacterium]|nr:hypothetical protein [Planctomycetia bacterium]
MLDLLADDPWPAFLVMMAVFAFCFWLFSRTTDRRYFFAALAAIVLALIPPGVSFFHRTPKREVRAALDGMVEAARRKNVPALMAFFANDFAADKINRAEVERRLNEEFPRLTIDSLSLTGVKIEAAKDKGTADFSAVLSGQYSSQGMNVPVPRYFLELVCEFERRPEGWRLVKAKRYVPGSKPRQELSFTSR